MFLHVAVCHGGIHQLSGVLCALQQGDCSEGSTVRLQMLRHTKTLRSSPVPGCDGAQALYPPEYLSCTRWFPVFFLRRRCIDGCFRQRMTSFSDRHQRGVVYRHALILQITGRTCRWYNRQYQPSLPHRQMPVNALPRLSGSETRCFPAVTFTSAERTVFHRITIFLIP